MRNLLLLSPCLSPFYMLKLSCLPATSHGNCFTFEDMRNVPKQCFYLFFALVKFHVFFLLGTINGLPIYQTKSTGLSLKEILDICVGQKVPQNKICSRVPSMVDQSAVFVVDLSAVNYKDLAADDCGIYGRHSSPSQAVHVHLDKDSNVVGFEKVRKGKETTVSNYTQSTYIVRRQYSWHSVTDEYRRIIVKVECNDKFLRLAVVQYIVNTSDTSVIFKRPYGNRNSSEPFQRTKPSVLAKIRKIGSSGSAKHIISQIESDSGDIATIPSASYLPRDRQQVYNQLKKVDGRTKSRSTGPSKTPSLTKLLTLQQSGTFVKNVSLSSRQDKKGNNRAAPNTFAASDTCLGWVKRFCKGVGAQAVAGLDMTYKLGPFHLTTLTFPNPMFVYKNKEGRHPTTLAAIMTSVTKEERDYEYMARCLKAERIQSLTYGTDGECALERGFESVFPTKDGCSGENIHLRCFDHAQGDISLQLKSMKVNGEQRKKITVEILGKECDGKRIKGLVDCDTADEFEKMYVERERDWPEEFKKWMLTEKGRVRSLKETLKECMLRPVRIAAGLGNPPNKWDNQRTEAINNVINEEADHQVSDQAAIHEILEARVIKQQESEYVKAIYNTGEYRLSPPFRHLAVSPLEWSAKTDEQKRQHIQKVLKGADISCKRDSVATKKLSISVADSAIASVPPGLLNQIWNEAEVILSHHSVIDVNGGVYCVTEYGSSTNVSISGGRIVCRCRKFTSTAGLCHHALAVAETNGSLAEYLTKFSSSEGKLKKIAFANIPQRAGEKPKEKKKRKGKNNALQRPISEE